MMKSAIVASALVILASPAFAGGKGTVNGGGGLLGGLMAPVTAAAGLASLQALNNVNLQALNNVNVLNGNRTTVAVPVAVKRNNILSGVLGGANSGHGCGCN
ncbi:MAG TPA: hypothetical protein VNQ99_08675 [Xanthobacteraceae bacterium]|nr:hypothetical protein [Xanthobacteraceae bacterium]